MRIIKRSTLAAYWSRNPGVETALRHWHSVCKRVTWRSFVDVRSTFPHADLVTVRSGKVVVVFNIGGNKCRLITAIHYNLELVFTLMVLSHPQYDQGRWKEVL